MKSSAAVAASMFAFTAEATAQAFDVKIPDAERGALGFGVLQSFQSGLPAQLGSDVNRRTHQFELEYGLFDWWKVTGVLPVEKPNGEPYVVANLAIENTFVLKGLDDKREHDVALGWFTGFDLSVRSDSTNAVVFGPLFAWKHHRATFAVNPLFEQTFGRNRVDGTAFAYAWQVKVDVREGFALGLEGYGTIENIGNPPPGEEQEHRVGPVAYSEIDLGHGVKIEPSLGVLFGLTESTPDVAVKLNIGVPLWNLRTRR